ncbi:MAG: carboxypeptidase-like regulatory domain-containing protein [Ignavibacteria bacterium]|nr:carboxypeptidase-like regulatory domain-containing protein [Ignavibacteria bacterium]
MTLFRNIFFLTIIFAINSFSQIKPHQSVKGIVLDDSTGLPIQSVNVFISNTSLGTTTDKNGIFEIKNVAVGYYDLIASMVGYHQFIQRILVAVDSKLNIRIKLKQKMFQFNEIEVVEVEPAVWNANLKRFLKLFFGDIPNSRHCELLNSRSLDFTIDTAKNFIAIAKEPLEIKNLALGYNITFYLETFKHDGNFLTITGDTKFVELEPKDENQKRTWEENRQKAFKGSLRHFLLSLLNGNLQQEGFDVFNLSSLFREEIIRKRVSEKEILFSSSLPYERIIRCPDYLEVEYRFGSLPDGYDLMKKKYTSNQVSWIHLELGSVKITTDGFIIEPVPPKIYGYWAWKRMADILPMDYLPYAIE